MTIKTLALGLITMIAPTVFAADVTVTPFTVPVIIHRDYNPVMGLTLEAEAPVQEIRVVLAGVKKTEINAVSLHLSDDKLSPQGAAGEELAKVKGSALSSKMEVVFKPKAPIAPKTKLIVSVTPTEKAPITNKLSATLTSLKIAGKPVAVECPTVTQRIGIAVTTPDQMVVDVKRKCKFFRIPGIARTNKGTLVAVFDNRFNHNADLPADITVGVSRSTDGGQTWSPIRTALSTEGMDGGQGVGDPAILYDDKNDVLWVAGLWSPKIGHPIFKSVPGSVSTKDCGQFLIASSKDDGKTWSKPINITADVKRLADTAETAEWGCLFQGPGNGICLDDGTLIFPGQIWGKQKYGVLVYSKDQGKTWTSSKATPHCGSESQVAVLSDGSLMLNAREGAGGPRAVSVTKDLGQTWTKFDGQKLTNPFCQGCLISAKVDAQHWLFFSNPNSGGRQMMTVKASKDDGKTWSKGVLYDQRNGMGYSAIIPVDEKTLGVFYEGEHHYLYFLQIPFAELCTAQ